jgi:hypothetical protein
MRTKMKPQAPPPVPGNTEWERFDNAVGKLVSVPKATFLKEEARLKRVRDRKRAKAKT